MALWHTKDSQGQIMSPGTGGRPGGAAGGTREGRPVVGPILNPTPETLNNKIQILNLKPKTPSTQGLKFMVQGCSSCSKQVQGYLAHKKPPPLRSPQ